MIAVPRFDLHRPGAKGATSSRLSTNPGTPIGGPGEADGLAAISSRDGPRHSIVLEQLHVIIRSSAVEVVSSIMQ
jgi:hypothetical protein